MFTIKSKIRYILLKISGKANHLKKSFECNHVWYGSRYGGFYLNPDLLNENSIVYSFGIGEDISFDNEIIKNHNCHVFGFDPTPKSVKWVREQNLSEKFHFYEFGVSNKSGFVDFFLPKKDEYVSGSLVEQENIDLLKKVRIYVKSIKDIMNDLGHKHIDVIKMDIEGSEYDIIVDILNAKISVTQILIEFHDRFYKDGKQKTKQTIKDLYNNGYEIFAISDSFEEISFINKFAIQKDILFNQD